ncbi:MAG: DUF1365 domain-containing protein [Proteobacteria bacterium]|nr:DUF1365 domain-containing protein [Pseudomonadota bacterium]MDA1057421.1 DUF1365 domain-containing protein [Pseudomonadota bacterium]
MTSAPVTALYVGKVRHVRLKPVRHKFVYRVFSIFADLDGLEAVSRRLRFFSLNRFNVLSFFERDHGDGKGNVRNWVRENLRTAGFRADGRIFIQCYPRMFGYVFNPLSVFYCYTSDGRLEAVMHQVSNTFGERHSYLLPVPPGLNGAAIHQSCDKQLYVSPFNALDHRYDFTVREPDERYAISIRESDADGDVLVATFTGRRAPLSDRGIIWAVVGHPLMTLKVIAAIHWEALRLWRKGMVVQKRPDQPPPAVSYQGPVEVEAPADNYGGDIQRAGLGVFSR